MKRERKDGRTSAETENGVVRYGMASFGPRLSSGVKSKAGIAVWC